ncbi:MAG: GxxExxY protein [Chitinophagaceae bacterium]|nr:GxxExxY protein [Chitinophagaceae bacterium]
MPKGVNELTGDILNACIKIHTKLGPGLLESVYENVLKYELEKLGYTVEQQKPVPVIYNDIKFEDGFRADLIVQGMVIIELKSVETLEKIHFKRTYTYLKLSNIHDGILVNFNVNLIKDGFHRLFNNHYKENTDL